MSTSLPSGSPPRRNLRRLPISIKISGLFHQLQLRQAPSLMDETGQPVVEVLAHAGRSAWKPGHPSSGMRGMRFRRTEPRELPACSQPPCPRPAHRYLIQVQADGDLAEDSELFEPDGKAHALTYRLTRGEPIRGTICNPDGVNLGQTGLVQQCRTCSSRRLDRGPFLSPDRRPRQRPSSPPSHAKIEADGDFRFPHSADNFVLLALTDAGSLLVPRARLSWESCPPDPQGALGPRQRDGYDPTASLRPTSAFSPTSPRNRSRS